MLNQRYRLSTYLIIDDVDPKHLAWGGVCQAFFTVKLLPSSFHMLFLQNKSLSVTNSVGREWCSLPWRKIIYIIYLRLFCARDLSLLLLLFTFFCNHVFISLWMKLFLGKKITSFSIYYVPWPCVKYHTHSCNPSHKPVGTCTYYFVHMKVGKLRKKRE